MQRPHHYEAFGLMAAAILAVAALGCSRGEVRGRIVGKVTFQGQPVPEGRVYFSDSGRGINMGAKLKEDGSYEVLTAQGAGLPLGDYTVWVTPPPPVPTPISAPPQPANSYDNIPQKYRNAQTSGLKLTVKEGQNQLDIDMKP
jgi:hypothetical protein